ncbi:hypothetical protein B0H34DRAFT_690456 [Crassisporium funariophilum]|nr:hypothetical protein B0H34DRAFT_690456 [Crassisporium funariophilum]
MHLPAWSIPVLKSSLFQQTAPFIVLFLIPALVFVAVTQLRRLSLHRLVFGLYHTLSMGLESLGFSLPWPWGSSSAAQDGDAAHARRAKRKSERRASGSSSKSAKNVRSRTEQIAMNKVGKQHLTDSDWEGAEYYPGLVNISGTYCFMNSTLQALASLSYLQPHIDAIHARAEALDVPTPVIDALQELFKNLNTAKSSYHSLRPHSIIQALSSPPPPISGSSNSSIPYHPSTSTTLFNSREHQDAQELFQLVSECIKNEMGAVEREGLRDRGMAGVLDLGRPGSLSLGSSPSYLASGSDLGMGMSIWGKDKGIGKDKGTGKGKEEVVDGNLLEGRAGLSSKSVFDGLTANRRSCVVCGYTEAVMHFGFDNWQLAVPRMATSCRLEDCLEDYTRLEILKDCICRKCSVLATHRRLLQEVRNLEDALAPPSSPSASIAPLASPSSGTQPTSPSGSSPFSPSSPAASSSAMPGSSSNLTKSKPSQSKKKRLREVKRMEQRVREALSEGRIEDEQLLEGIRLERVVSPASTKQAMIARPPPVLALHLNRSVHYGQHAAKNTIRVHFPEVLDLTPYTTSGSLSTVPTSAISTPQPLPSSSSSSVDDDGAEDRPRRSTTPTPETYAPGTQRTIYRLAAVVCHYGQHSFGHYICYRRKPRRGFGGHKPPTMVDPLRMGMDEDDDDADVEEDADAGDEDSGVDSNPMMNGSGKPRSAQKTKAKPYSTPETRYHWEDHSEFQSGTGKGWLRISDDSVGECGIESVLTEGSGAFMLYYERAVQPRVGVYGSGSGQGKGASKPIRIPNGNATIRRTVLLGAQEMDGETDGGADTDADGFSIGSEETLKPEMKVVDLNGSVGSLVSEVGVGVMKRKGKEKERVRDRDRERSKSTDGRASPMSMSSSVNSLYSSKVFGPRIVRSVNARRGRPSPETGTVLNTSSVSESASSGSVHSNGSAAPLPPPAMATDKIKKPLANGAASHVHDDLDESIPPEMTASAPSILSLTSPSGSRSSGASTTGVQKSPLGSGSSSGLGSRSTRMVLQPSTNAANAPATAASPVGIKVRAR